MDADPGLCAELFSGPELFSGTERGESTFENIQEGYQEKSFFCLNAQKDEEKQILCIYQDELCSCI